MSLDQGSSVTPSSTDLPITVEWRRAAEVGPCSACTAFPPGRDHAVAVVRVGGAVLQVCISCIGRLIFELGKQRTMSDHSVPVGTVPHAASSIDTTSPVH